MGKDFQVGKSEDEDEEGAEDAGSKSDGTASDSDDEDDSVDPLKALVKEKEAAGATAASKRKPAVAPTRVSARARSG